LAGRGMAALRPATEEARESGHAMIGAQVALERGPRDPAFAELDQRLEQELADDADRAGIARVDRDAQHLRLFARFVPRAAAAPRAEEEARQIGERERS